MLGDLWAQQLGKLISRIKPYPDVPDTDVTPTMVKLGFTPLKMFKMAEEFYVSIGMYPMTKTFWEKSFIEKPKDGRTVVCHGSAHDFTLGDDYRQVLSFLRYFTVNRILYHFSEFVTVL